MLYQFNIVNRVFFAPLILEDIERGERLFNYTGAAAFAWFIYLYRFKTTFQTKSFVYLMICGASIYLTQSRVFILFVILVSMLYVLNLSTSTMRRMILSVIFIVSIPTFYAVFDTNFNPYSWFSSDTSGFARSLEYDTARQLIREHWFFGVGIAPGSEELEAVTGSKTFAAGDLGAFGIWYDWGLIGLALFGIASWICCMPIKGMGTDTWPLFLTGCLIAGYGCSAPIVFYPAGATFFAVLLGLWLASRQRMPASVEPRPYSAAESA